MIENIWFGQIKHYSKETQARLKDRSHSCESILIHQTCRKQDQLDEKIRKEIYLVNLSVLNLTFLK